MTSEFGSYTSGGVVDFLNGRVRGITAAGGPTRNTYRDTYISTALTRLETMRESSKDAEEETYRMLGVVNLEELQKRIDDINNEGLINLSNKVLRRMPVIKDMRGPTAKQIDEFMTKKFNEFLGAIEGRRESVIQKNTKTVLALTDPDKL